MHSHHFVTTCWPKCQEKSTGVLQRLLDFNQVWGCKFRKRGRGKRWSQNPEASGSAPSKGYHLPLSITLAQHHLELNVNCCQKDVYSRTKFLARMGTQLSQCSEITKLHQVRNWPPFFPFQANDQTCLLSVPTCVFTFFSSLYNFAGKGIWLNLFGLTHYTNISRTWRASKHACVFSWRELTFWCCHRQASFRDIYTGTDSTFFFSPRGITLTKFVFPLDFFFSQQLAKRGGESQLLICTNISFVWSQSLGITHQKARKLQRSRGMEQDLDLPVTYSHMTLKKKKENPTPYFPGYIWRF